VCRVSGYPGIGDFPLLLNGSRAGRNALPGIRQTPNVPFQRSRRPAIDRARVGGPPKVPVHRRAPTARYNLTVLLPTVHRRGDEAENEESAQQ
jgi:hypothetical protein